MGKQVKKEEFEKLLRAKSRSYAITTHALERSKKRALSIDIFKRDLESGSLILAIEEEAQGEHERKFDVYYRQDGDYCHRYIMVLNDCLRLITLMRVSKGKQLDLLGKR